MQGFSDILEVSVIPDTQSNIQFRRYRAIDARRYHPYRHWEPLMPIESLSIEPTQTGDLVTMDVVRIPKKRHAGDFDPAELKARLRALRLEEHRRRVRRLANVMVEFVRGLTHALHVNKQT